MLSIKKNTKSGVVASALLAAFVTTGCTSGLGGADYERNAVGIPAESRMGTIVSVRQVNIEGSSSGLGSAGGAAIGGALGSTVGGGDAERLAVGIAGAIIGGIAGAAVEEGTTRQAGTEYTVQLEGGQTITVVQGEAQPVAGNGQQVRVLYGDRVRVVPAY